MNINRRTCSSCSQPVVDALITGTASPTDSGPEHLDTFDDPLPVVIDATPGPFGRYWRTDVAVATVVDLAPHTHPAAHRQHICGGTASQ